MVKVLDVLPVTYGVAVVVLQVTPSLVPREASYDTRI